MGAFHSVHQEDNYEALATRTGFSPEQIRNLHRRFKHLSKNEDKLRREHFTVVSDLELNPIQSQIIEAFFDERNFQDSGRGTVTEISFQQFLIVMSCFLPTDPCLTAEERENVRQRKLRFLFNMYDTDDDGKITVEEYRHVVQVLISQSDNLDKEEAKEIADAAMLEVASLNVVHMAPDEFYEGITFEHFVKIWTGIEIETKMHVRFSHLETPNICK
ncbi:tescalcin a [Brienomyrus brachyistius]|uniref:tescalcin a n=1 Tax=Brienomyrus brachyistius TaxID=42636 RepID=UPI0020B36DDD|nr:tescalcin a [Brienomyrus brachyistius]